MTNVSKKQLDAKKKELYDNNRFIQALRNEKPTSFNYGYAEKLAKRYGQDTYLDKNGLVRWKKNDNIPNIEILVLWKYRGRRFDLFKNIAAFNGDTAKAANRYFEQVKQHTLSSDEKRMQRALRSGRKLI